MPSAAIIALCLIIYLPVAGHEFINFDDDLYVLDTPVQDGFTMRGLAWAFGSTKVYWMPLTRLSFLADAAVYGLRPGGFHLTNLLLHITNALLLFLLLRRLIGRFWPSAFAAALFAAHPLQVESVAWVAERKGVLSATFWLATLSAYVHYLRRPSAGRYLVTLGTFALGCMTKPMVVTLPLVLVVLDWWPLGRFARVPSGGGASLRGWLRPLLEKAPLLLVSALFGALTIVTQQQIGALVPLAALPLHSRLLTVPAVYFWYLVKAVRPDQLSVFYPRPETIPPLWETGGLGLLLVAVTTAMILQRARRPHLPAGWIWFLVLLVPVIGLGQSGLQLTADRYAYLPLIGLIVMTTGFPVIPAFIPARLRVLVPVCAVLLVVSLAAASRMQVRQWRNNRSLFEQALRVDGDNWMAHHQMGIVEALQGNEEAALYHFDRAIDLKPGYRKSYLNAGILLAFQGRIDEALEYLANTDSFHSRFLVDLGMNVMREGKPDVALSLFRRVLALWPEDPDALEGSKRALDALVRRGEAPAPMDDGGLSRGGTPGAGGAP